MITFYLSLCDHCNHLVAKFLFTLRVLIVLITYLSNNKKTKLLRQFILFVSKLLIPSIKIQNQKLYFYLNPKPNRKKHYCLECNKNKNFQHLSERYIRRGMSNSVSFVVRLVEDYREGALARNKNKA
ncbi:hypothetical protein BpHYR1_053737 [Brachionus plicatilis]|uniref:Uncharacterized protein n=1 Tax=Brachionus plicatilis TaxID=10195 RepID=A0A3M7RR14_BRAPC|nr:hypothetical protein BpHYR1_053737 [Brachionus plicatilis]